MKITGKTWIYGDNVNTDVIFPGKYNYAVTDMDQMGQYAMEDLDPDFQKNAKPGDIIVAGENFGCGSSREQAVKCLKARGISAVIAKSFSRIYYRNGINNGVLLINCPAFVEAASHGEKATEIDPAAGVIVGEQETYHFVPAPDFLGGIIADGGIIEHLQKLNNW